MSTQPFVVVSRVGLRSSSSSVVSGCPTSVFGSSSRRLSSAVWGEVAVSPSGRVVAGRCSSPTVDVVPSRRCPSSDGQRCPSSDGHRDQPFPGSGLLLWSVVTRSRPFVVGCSRQRTVFMCRVTRVVDSRYPETSPSI